MGPVLWIAALLIEVAAAIVVAILIEPGYDRLPAGALARSGLLVFYVLVSLWMLLGEHPAAFLAMVGVAIAAAVGATIESWRNPAPWFSRSLGTRERDDSTLKRPGPSDRA